MWRSSIESINGGRGRKFMVTRDHEPVTYAEVISCWRNDRDFRDFFVSWLMGAPFHAFRWETPPVTFELSTRAFEFVVLRADALDRPVDVTAFASYFAPPREANVVAFRNLGGDATMVVPRPIASEAIYGHLASFLRHAPESQVHELWQVVGRTMQEQLGERPIWLSTAGMGVSWLHIRVDSRPKYYGYEPYRTV